MKKKVTEISCDFCGKEIEKSTPSVVEQVYLGGNESDEEPFKNVLVEIRVSWPEPRRRKPDCCEVCLFKAARLAGPITHLKSSKCL